MPSHVRRFAFLTLCLPGCPNSEDTPGATATTTLSSTTGTTSPPTSTTTTSGSLSDVTTSSDTAATAPTASTPDMDSTGAPNSTGSGSSSSGPAGWTCNNDGKQNPGEECDEGLKNVPPRAVGDAYHVCTTECTLENYCGDHILQQGHEQCECDGDDCTTSNGAQCTACQYDSRYVFVTSVAFDGALTLGKLTGVEAAHALCNVVAQQGEMNGVKPLAGRVFKAWISDGMVGPLDWLGEDDPLDKFPPPQEYRLLTNELFIESIAELVAKQPHVALDVDEDGQLVPASSVWTNVNNSGSQTTTDVDCAGWTSKLGDGRVGRSDSIDEWTVAEADPTLPCHHVTGRLYCFEQTPLQKANEKLKAQN